MTRLAALAGAFALTAQPAWAHEDAQAHTHGEVIAAVAALGAVFAVIVAVGFARGRQRGDQK